MKLYCEIIKRCLTEAKNTIQTFIDSIVLFFFYLIVHAMHCTDNSRLSLLLLLPAVIRCEEFLYRTPFEMVKAFSWLQLTNSAFSAGNWHQQNKSGMDFGPSAYANPLRSHRINLLFMKRNVNNAIDCTSKQKHSAHISFFSRVLSFFSPLSF